MLESSRWLLVRGRGGEALDVLNKLARVNGKKLPSILRLVNPAGVREGESIEKKIQSRIEWVAKRMVSGFDIGFVYSEVQLKVENLNFSLYLTVAINVVREIPAFFIGSLLLGFTNHPFSFLWLHWPS